MSGGRGHRSVPHTADVILEAWGPDLASCFEEAIAALVELYATPGPASVTATDALHLPTGEADELLLELLDEVIFLLDTADAVPVGARVTATGHGLEVTIDLAARDSVTATGAVPKAISRSELQVVAQPAMTRCRFLVDV